MSRSDNPSKPGGATGAEDATAAHDASRARSGSFSYATSHEFGTPAAAGREERSDAYMERAAADRTVAADAYGDPAPAGETEAVPDLEGPAVAHPRPRPERRRSFAATMLMLLVGTLAVAALTLWLAPRIAPSLPESMASYLTRAGDATTARLDALEQRLGEQVAAVEEVRAAALQEGRDELAALAAQVKDQQQTIAELQQALAAAGDDGTAQALEQATSDRATMTGRISELDSALQNLRSEIDAMNDELARGDEGPTNPELSASLAQVRERLDGVVSTVEEKIAALQQTVDDQVSSVQQMVDGKVQEMNQTVQQAVARADEAEEKQKAAEEQATAAEAAAARDSAFTELATAFEDGNPYAEELGAAEQAAGTDAPEPLARHADTGIPSTKQLEARVSDVAQDAMAAERRANSEGDVMAQASSWFSAKFSGRPTQPTEGDDAAAVISRAENELRQGDPQAALTEVETLPEDVRAALGGWYEDLKARAEAAKALADWRQSAGAEG